MSREICRFDIFKRIADSLRRLSSADLIERINDAWNGLRSILGSGRLHVYIDEAHLLRCSLRNRFESVRYKKRFHPMLSGVAHFFNQKLCDTTYLVFTG